MGEFKPEQSALEHPSVKLRKRLSFISNENNKRIEEEYGKQNLIKTDGSVSMDAFMLDNGGIYSKEEIEEDKATIRKRELSFAKCHSEDPTSQDRCLNRWREDKMRRNGTQTEIMVTILLNKVLGDDFLVMRTASYDDYEAGTDFIIVNKKTGKTICALDSLLEDNRELSEGALPLTIKKADKTLAIVESGGADLKYGIKIKNKEMILTPLKNMPVFYFDLSDKQYKKLSENNPSEENTVTKTELSIFYSFITSLQDQRESLLLADKIKQGDPVMLKILAFKTETLDAFISIYNKRVNELNSK